MAALLLASCTTSGQIQLANPSFTNAEPGVAGLMAEAAASAGAESGAAAAPGAEGATGADPNNASAAATTSEDSTTLPVEVAYVPGTKPAAPASGETAAADEAGSEPQAGVTAVAAEPQQDTAGAPAPERFGSAAPQTAQPKKRGFFASLFAAPEAQSAAAAATPAPEASAEEQSAAAVPQSAPTAAPAAETSSGEEKPAGEPAAAEPAPTEVAAASPAPTESKKRSFLASFFAPAEATAAPVPIAPKPLIAQDAKPKMASASAKPLVTLASANRSGSFEDDGGLPGVRADSLFEITRKSGLDDDSDIDLHEDEGSPVQFASAAGMARLAPNGLLKQRESVDVACLKPTLVRMLKAVESHYGKRMIVTSGYRSPEHNRRVRGARNSMHMYCAAADVQVPGVSKWELAKFVRAMPGRGGVGTYCHTNSVHIDVGPERDWNWRCRRRK